MTSAEEGALRISAISTSAMWQQLAMRRTAGELTTTIHTSECVGEHVHSIKAEEY